MSAATSGATGAPGSYGAASYCSAIKALGQAAPAKSAAGPAPSSANEERLQALDKRAQAAQVKAWREVCAVLEEILPGWGNTPGTGVDVAVAAIRELAKQRRIDTFAAQSFAIVRGYRVETTSQPWHASLAACTSLATATGTLSSTTPWPASRPGSWRCSSWS
ncbi:hypothetical protein [Pseudoduganella buxea]|uniref:Uncharacterized protein n=1 Tax=Pseudoduganella buxea TaxID=1949069 RepID=A0A6I3SV51_9BURK|nr:hypothetical protein [Pseudoduganella buxea]MTV53078.1 hypothetical protein [Pseudoduganella buxea]